MSDKIHTHNLTSGLVRILVKIIEKVKELDGAIDSPKKEIPKVGWFAHITDLDGNIIGLFEDLKKE